MRRGRWIVMALAALVGGGVFAWTAQPVEHRVERAVSLDIEAARAELDRVEREARALGYEDFERVELPAVYGGTVARDWAPDRCLVVAAAVWGRQRVDSIRDHQGASVGDSIEFWNRVRRVYVRRACAADEPTDGLAQTSLSVTRLERGVGGGQLLVFRGSPTLPLPAEGGLTEAQTSDVHYETPLAEAGQKGTVVFILLLLIGMTMENAFRRSADPPSDAVTVRTISVSLPADERLALRPLVDRVREGEVDAVYELRAHLLGALERAERFELGRLRDRLARVDPRVDEICRAFGEHADPQKPAGYREREAGECVVSLVLVHRCELPGMPLGDRSVDLRIALEHSLPADREELVAAEAFLHPRDPSLTLDASEAAAVLAHARISSPAPEALGAAPAKDRPT